MRSRRFDSATAAFFPMMAIMPLSLWVKRGAEIMGAVGIAIVVGEGFGAVEPGKSSANDDDGLRAFHD